MLLVELEKTARGERDQLRRARDDVRAISAACDYDKRVRNALHPRARAERKKAARALAVARWEKRVAAVLAEIADALSERGKYASEATTTFERLDQIRSEIAAAFDEIRGGRSDVTESVSFLRDGSVQDFANRQIEKRAREKAAIDKAAQSIVATAGTGV